MKRDKLIFQLYNNPKNLRFQEFEKILDWAGFILSNVKGSHRVYSHPEIKRMLPIQPDKNGYAKVYQVEQFIKLVDEFQLLD